VISNHPAAADVCAKTMHIAVIRCTAKTMCAIFKNQALLSQVNGCVANSGPSANRSHSRAVPVYVKTAFWRDFPVRAFFKK
jgi:hypothetical protein